MKNWKDKVDWEKNRPLYLIMAVLLAMVIYQQFLITDLQERMMNIESSRYDDQLNDIRWEAETALSQNEEQDKDILQPELAAHGNGMGHLREIGKKAVKK